LDIKKPQRKLRFNPQKLMSKFLFLTFQ
jgi:hypothetical protein